MPGQPNILELQKIASQVRRDIVRMVHGAQSGHPGGSLGCTEFFVAMYFHILRHQADFNIDGKGEDLFFLSNGHITPIWYSVLARSGYFDRSELSTFRKINSQPKACHFAAKFFRDITSSTRPSICWPL